jgi:hypothetical protein
MRGRTSEGCEAYATGHGKIDWDAEFEICVEDLIEAGLRLAPGEPERPVLTYAQILERERAEAGTPPPDPATLPDRILRELTAIPDVHLKNGCLLQDLVFKHLFVAAQLDKADLSEVKLIELIYSALANADPSHYALTAPPLDDPLGPERTIPLATLPRFVFRAPDRMRFWRIEAGAPDTEVEGNRNEPALKVAPADTAAPESQVDHPPLVDHDHQVDHNHQVDHPVVESKATSPSPVEMTTEAASVEVPETEPGSETTPTDAGSPGGDRPVSDSEAASRPPANAMTKTTNVKVRGRRPVADWKMVEEEVFRPDELPWRIC